MILLLGGAQFATLEVEIYRQTAQLLDLRTAAVLSLLQMTALVVLLFLYSRYQQRSAIQQRQLTRGAVARRPRTRGERAIVFANLAAMAVVLGLPLFMLLERSLAGPNGYGLDNFASLFSTNQHSALFVPPIEAIQNSLVFALIATLISAPLGLMAAYVIARGKGRLASGFDALLMLPLGTSAVIIGFGFLVALGNLPIDLRTSIILDPNRPRDRCAAVPGARDGAGPELRGRAVTRCRARARCLTRARVARDRSAHR